ncbi:hypothetical protein RFI_15748, partial [Reticulomyxa filosa]
MIKFSSFNIFVKLICKYKSKNLQYLIKKISYVHSKGKDMSWNTVFLKKRQNKNNKMTTSSREYSGDVSNVSQLWPTCSTLPSPQGSNNGVNSEHRLKCLSFFSDNLRTLLENKCNKSYYDVVFIVGTSRSQRRKYFGLSALFAIHSKVFEKLLFGHMQESQSVPYTFNDNGNGNDNDNDNDNENEKGLDESPLDSEVGWDGGQLCAMRLKQVVIEDLECQVFEYLMKLFYGFEAPLTTSIISGVLYASHKYMIEALKEECLLFIEKLLRNCSENIQLIDVFIQVIHDAYKYGMKEAIDNIVCHKDYGLFHNPTLLTQIITSRLFCRLPEAIITQIISADI